MLSFIAAAAAVPRNVVTATVVATVDATAPTASAAVVAFAVAPNYCSDFLPFADSMLTPSPAASLRRPWPPRPPLSRWARARATPTLT